MFGGGEFVVWVVGDGVRGGGLCRVVRFVDDLVCGYEKSFFV